MTGPRHASTVRLVEQPPVLDPDLWRGVDRVLDRARTAGDVRSHGLELLALRRFRATGRDVPADFALAERRAITALLAVPVLLQRIRDVVDGPLLVLKGPEVAARYPRTGLRAFGDLDLLVEEPEPAQRALLGAGFEPAGEEWRYRDIHHLRPLHLAGMPVVVELHSRPKWVSGLAPPAARELVAAGVPGALGVAGVLALPPAQHAVILAVHSWAHEPLRRLRDLVDVAAVAQGVPERELRAVATAWGVERLWSATAGAIRSVLFEGSPTWPVRTWARSLPAVRERSVFESHLEGWLSAFSTEPAATALREGARAFLDDLRPERDESWREKARRTRTALKNAFVGRTRHQEELRRQRERNEE